MPQRFLVPVPTLGGVGAVNPLVVPHEHERRHAERFDRVGHVRVVELLARVAAGLDVADVHEEVRRAVQVVEIDVLDQVGFLAGAVRIIAGGGEDDGLTLRSGGARDEGEGQDGGGGERDDAADSVRSRCRSHGCKSWRRWDPVRLRLRSSA